MDRVERLDDTNAIAAIGAVLSAWGARVDAVHPILPRIVDAGGVSFEAVTSTLVERYAPPAESVKLGGWLLRLEWSVVPIAPITEGEDHGA